MRIAIVEDQKSEQERLGTYIQTYCKEHQIEVDIRYYNDGFHIVSDYQPQFDVIYLDVEMEILDGMSTARKIRETDKDVLIVFVTNHSQVAIQGYSVEAIDFLLKPLSNFVFEEHFKKILRRLPQEEELIYIKNRGNTIKIAQKELLYIENEGHTLYLHTPQQTFTTSGSMKNMEQALNPTAFFRSNSCYIVNLAFVEKVEGNTAFVAGTPLQISRPRKKAFMEALTNFIGDQLL